jgi:hypothetical protein
MIAKSARPATIEMLSGPYIIIEHDAVLKYDEIEGGIVERHPSGFIVYYNRPGNSTHEFMYLLDTLSNHQILDSDCSLRIRVACDTPSQNIRSNFDAAKKMYGLDWGFDEYKMKKINRIEFALIENRQKSFLPTNIGWRQ